MMNSWGWGRTVEFVVILALALIAVAAAKMPVTVASPHAEALGLVLAEDAKYIAGLEADHESWWHDTMKREWSVIRPFSPGDYDSTHTFIVVYSIDGREQAQWSVDTREGVVQRVDAAKRGDGNE